MKFTFVYLDEAEIRHSHGRPPRRFLKRGFHLQSQNRYYQQFYKLFEALISLRADHTNPLELMVGDYIDMVYQNLTKGGHKPNLSQLGAGKINMLHFEEWIDEHEEYWRDDGQTYDQIKGKANTTAIRIADARNKLAKRRIITNHINSPTHIRKALGSAKSS